MKHLSRYKVFESHNCSEPTNLDGLMETFSHIIHDPKIVSIPYGYHGGCDFYIYIMYGDRTEPNEHEFLRELYGYHDIIRKIYNKDYYYINIKSECIIIFFDYERKNDGTRIGTRIDKDGNGKLLKHQWTSKNDLNTIKMSLLRDKLPNDIYNEIYKTSTDWRTISTWERCVDSGIVKKDGWSNLSFYDWIYEPAENPIKYNKK